MSVRNQSMFPEQNIPNLIKLNILERIYRNIYVSPKYVWWLDQKASDSHPSEWCLWLFVICWHLKLQDSQARWVAGRGIQCRCPGCHLDLELKILCVCFVLEVESGDSWDMWTLHKLPLLRNHISWYLNLPIFILVHLHNAYIYEKQFTCPLLQRLMKSSRKMKTTYTYSQLFVLSMEEAWHKWIANSKIMHSLPK